MEVLKNPEKTVQTFTFVSKTEEKLEIIDEDPNNPETVEERPLPKLIYQVPPLPLSARVHTSLSSLRSRGQQSYEESNAFLKKEIWPRLSPLKFLIEVIICNLIMLISAPVILTWTFLVILVRQGVTIYLKSRYGDKYTLMCGADAAWGINWYANDNCFMSLYVLEGECSIDKIRNRMQNAVIDKIDSTKNNSLKFTYEPMRCKISQKCGFFCWEKHPQFQISDHVKFVRNDPQATMTDEDVFNEIRTFVDEPLPKDLPQWEILVVPKFIYKSQENSTKSHYALIWRINHSIMDGISAVTALGQCIADNPVKMSVDPVEIKGPAWYLRVLIYLQIFILGPRSFIKTMIKKDSNCFHGPGLTGPKTLTWSRPLSIQTLKVVKDTLNSSTTAVLLSALGRSLSNLAEKKNLPVPKKIIGGMTCAVLPYPDYRPQNRFTVASFSLKLDINCPRERLESAAKSIQGVVNAAEILKNFNLIRLAGLNPVASIKPLMDSLQATFLLSNVPGPAECYNMFEGDKLVDVTAWNTIKGRTAIGVCLFSYAGKLRAGVMADSAALPNPSDVPTLVQDFEREVVELARISGVPEHLVFKEDF